jgi:hypothetical protein
MSAAAARDHAPVPEEGGLRTALRNVPLLPAPANVDDLLARLDAEEVPFSSGPLAELISDARVIDLEPSADEADDFFAPVSHAANTNLAPPLASRLRGALFGAGLVAGAVLIGWNALMGPEAVQPETEISAPPAVIAPIVRTPSPAEAQAPIDAPAPETRTIPDPVQATETAGGATAPAADPQVPPLPEITQPMVEAKASQPAETVAPAEIIALPRPPEVSPLALADFAAEAVAPPVPETTAIPSDETGRASGSSRTESAETFASLPQAELPQPLTLPAVSEAPAAAPNPPIESAALTPHEIIQAPVDVASEARPVAAAPAALSRRAARRLAQADRKAASADPVAAGALAAPAPPTRPKLAARAPYAGVWAATPEACSPEMQEKEGHLLTRISASRGRAGDASCAFKRIRRTGNLWTMAATCTDGETTWASDVRLSLTRGRLTWTSQKGSTTYMRCPRA